MQSDYLQSAKVKLSKNLILKNYFTLLKHVLFKVIIIILDVEVKKK